MSEYNKKFRCPCITTNVHKSPALGPWVLKNRAFVHLRPKSSKNPSRGGGGYPHLPLANFSALKVGRWPHNRWSSMIESCTTRRIVLKESNDVPNGPVSSEIRGPRDPKNHEVHLDSQATLRRFFMRVSTVPGECKFFQKKFLFPQEKPETPKKMFCTCSTQKSVISTPLVRDMTDQYPFSPWKGLFLDHFGLNKHPQRPNFGPKMNLPELVQIYQKSTVGCFSDVFAQFLAAIGSLHALFCPPRELQIGGNGQLFQMFFTSNCFFLTK
jgi:hypothetical protein